MKWYWWTAIALGAAIAIGSNKNVQNSTMEAIWDIKSELVILTLDPNIRDKARAVIKAAENKGIYLRVTSGLRTWAEQQKLYDQGRTAPGKIVTNAKPGSSYHNYGLAFDVVEIKAGKALWTNPNWATIGAIGKAHGFEWGGDWKSLPDKPHFQFTFGKSVSQLATLYKAGKRNGNYVTLTA